MMTMIDEYLTAEMFEFNALSQFSIALLWQLAPCDLCQGQSIQGQGHKLKAKTGQSKGQGQEIRP